jgi:hypothetical protein
MMLDPVTFDEVIWKWMGGSAEKLEYITLAVASVLGGLVILKLVAFVPVMMIRTVYFYMFPRDVDDPVESFDLDESKLSAMECGSDVQSSRNLVEADRGQPGGESTSVRPSRRSVRR